MKSAGSKPSENIYLIAFYDLQIDNYETLSIFNMATGGHLEF